MLVHTVYLVPHFFPCPSSSEIWSPGWKSRWWCRARGLTGQSGQHWCFSRASGETNINAAFQNNNVTSKASENSLSLYRFNEFVPHDLNCLLRCHIYTFFILVFLLIWFNQMVHLVIRFKFIFFAITNVSLFVLSNQQLEKKTFNLTVGLFQTYLHLSLMIISSGDGTTAVVVRIRYQYGL